MSAEIKTCFTNTFLRDTELSYKAKLTYIILKSHLDLTDPTRPVTASIPTIAQQANIAMTSVKQGLRELQEKGYIRREQRYNESARTFILKRV